jgi:hypothetical protein
MSKRLSEIQSNIVDEILWGNSFHGHDIDKVIDGEDMSPYFRLKVARKQDDADEWFKELVTRYVENTEELIDLYLQDEKEMARDSHVYSRRKEIAEAV